MKKLGIVFGAGGVRGIAQIGILQALSENGIKPACISGASSGALVGALAASGMTPEEIYTDIRKLKAFNILPSFPNPLGKGLFTTTRLHKRLERYMGKKTIAELEIPFCCAATSLGNGELRIFDGDTEAVSAVLASCCIPGIFKPEVIDGVPYIDGGMVASNPIDAIRRYEPDVIVAIDTRCTVTKDRTFRNFAGVLWQMYEIMNDDITQGKLKSQEPDLVIRPVIEDMNLYDLKKLDYAYRCGYEAGLANIGMIKALLEDDARGESAAACDCFRRSEKVI